MLKGIETAVYYVNDLKAATKWYAETFNIKPNHESDFYVGFTVGGFELGLHPTEGKRVSGLGGQTAYWTVTDIKEAMQHLIKCGAKEDHPVMDVGGLFIGSVLDPFGNEFGLIQNPKSPNL
jgi:predicted enzyme related to lactoylglutathione lyase